MKNKYTLRCIAPDGDAVREGEFETVEAAWNRAADMGSRWFFYPVSIITGTADAKRARIVAVPDGMDASWIGRKLATLQKVFAANSQHICDWVNGKCPLDLMP